MRPHCERERSAAVLFVVAIISRDPRPVLPSEEHRYAPDTGKTYDRIDNARNDSAHSSEDGRHDVKLEDTDQTPVQGSYNDQN